MIKKIVIASALALVASASFAQSAPSAYAGVDVGTVDVEFAGFDDSETAAGVFVGYNFNDNFALEANYRQAKFDPVKIQQLGLSVIGTLPLSNGFNVYGRLGYNDIDLKQNVAGGTFSNDFDSGVVYGVGAGYAFTPTISGRVEYQRPHSDATIITAGVSFKF